MKRDVNLNDIDAGVKIKFKWDWLQNKVDSDEYFSDCFRNLKDAGLVYSVYCEDKINYGSSGKKALRRHVKRPSHVTESKEKATQPALRALFEKVKRIENGDINPVKDCRPDLPYMVHQNMLLSLYALVIHVK